MNYLMIQNAGVAPTEAFTLLGMSMTESSDARALIGQFGSGNKLAINLLLRLGIKAWVYCGKTRLEFFTQSETISDGLDTKEVEHVMCKFSGTSSKTINCGWTLDWGKKDWTDPAMALREFISNAIDRTIRSGEGFQQAIMDGDLIVASVMETQRRAADGFTRVYVELTEAVHKYFAELPRRFLHFSDNPNQVFESTLPKAERNLSNRKTPMIYRCGVFVREMREGNRDSLFDYNFTADQMKIDESRNSSEWETRAACARLMGKVDIDTLATVMKSLVRNEETFESHLDAEYILPSWETPDEQTKENWTEAWDKANENAPAVLCLEGSVVDADIIRKKGYTPKKVRSQSWVKTAQRMGVQHSSDILTEDEVRGRQVIPATDDAVQEVNRVWGWIEAIGMTKGKDVPKAIGFRELGEPTSTMGYWVEGTNEIYLREDLSAATYQMIRSVVLEMIAHYVTGSTECAKDYQQFLLDLIVELAC